MNFLFKGLHWIINEELVRGDVRIAGGKILEMAKNLSPFSNETTLHFENHFLYPGLINAHDHLEMNLYPRLGHPPYANYVAWGNDIYKPKQSPIKEIERVDIETRLLWGGLKNLISGVTTVIHHNSWRKMLGGNQFPVRVLQTAWAHSLAFGKNITGEFTRASGTPFVIHAAEGIDGLAAAEIEKLSHLGVLESNTVIIHGISLSQNDLALIASRNSSLVWCPASNEYLFQKTANISSLKKIVRVALGSDSTLTGSPVMLDEMRAALATGLVTSREIYEMVTVNPARIFNIPAPEITQGSIADFMVVPQLHPDYFQNLVQVQPSDLQVVFVNGAPRYGDEKINDSLKLKYSFQVQGVKKFSSVNVPDLLSKLSKRPGKSILNSNPLWKMLSING